MAERARYNYATPGWFENGVAVERHIVVAMTAGAGLEQPGRVLRVYVDGVMVTTSAQGNVGCVSGFHYPNDVARSFSGSEEAPGWDGGYFAGTMRDLHFWDVWLNSNEVADLYNAGGGEFGTFPPRPRPPRADRLQVRDRVPGLPAAAATALRHGRGARLCRQQLGHDRLASREPWLDATVHLLGVRDQHGQPKRPPPHLRLQQRW